MHSRAVTAAVLTLGGVTIVITDPRNIWVGIALIVLGVGALTLLGVAYRRRKRRSALTERVAQARGRRRRGRVRLLPHPERAEDYYDDTQGNPDTDYQPPSWGCALLLTASPGFDRRRPS